ncbi:MAG: hypothetical protein GKR89_15575 [Candidatus Latescibacteria bacterium]|nr:hypothetical protein [Candidatus Latescibacterota bacterium]
MRNRKAEGIRLAKIVYKSRQIEHVADLVSGVEHVIEATLSDRYRLYGHGDVPIRDVIVDSELVACNLD